MDGDDKLFDIGEKAALLCVDLQKCYYRPPITHLFPKLEENVTKVLDISRRQGLPVIHVRQEDKWDQSPWLPWWSSLHPGQEDDLGVPEPLDCSVEKDEEPIFIKNTFDGFFGTGLHDHLQKANIDTLVVMGLITRACVLNTVMSGFNHGYRIFLIEDCCGDRDVQVHESVMSTYDGYNCVVIKSQQLINNFKSK